MDVRSDFPTLSRQIDGKPVIYLDSACMSLKPHPVIEAVLNYYKNLGSCAGRSVHKLSVEASRLVQESRSSIARMINAEPGEIVFTKNTTEALNLLSHSLELEQGDVVLTSDVEHNSNLVPWQMLSKKGVGHKVFPTSQGQVDLDEFRESLTPDVKVVSVVHTSNLLGTTLPIKEMAEIAHDNGSIFIADAAQSVPHMPVDVKELGVDFLCFSVHKMCGPTGLGVLYGRRELLDELRPFLTGGDTVKDSTYEDSEMLAPPRKFEAGLQHYAGIIGGGAAAEYLMSVGLDKIEKHDRKLSKLLHDGLFSLDHVEMISPEGSGSLATFVPHNVDAHDLALILSETDNIFVRSGRHCVHSYYNSRGLGGGVRASLYLYNDSSDVEKFLARTESVLNEFNR